MQRKLDQREIPAEDLIGGLILLIAGVLLLTPGFFTDLIGFLCLIPKLRETVARKVIMHLVANSERGPDKHTVIVEGEFWEEDEPRKRLHR